WFLDITTVKKMIRIPLSVLIFSSGILFPTIEPVCAEEKGKLPGDLADRFTRDISPLIKTHCLGCHNSKKASGKFNLEAIQTAEALARPLVGKKIWERVRTHQMPPPERKQPTFAERRRFIAWIEDAFMEATLDGQRDPGPLPARRLNVRETMNTLRD